MRKAFLLKVKTALEGFVTALLSAVVVGTVGGLFGALAQGGAPLPDSRDTAGGYFWMGFALLGLPTFLLVLMGAAGRERQPHWACEYCGTRNANLDGTLCRNCLKRRRLPPHTA